MTKDETLRLALEYVELVPDDRYNADHIDRDALTTAIKAALEAKDEPVAWISAVTGDLTAHDMSHTFSWAPLYTTPPQRKPLTEIALLGAYEEEQKGRWGDHVRGLRAIESAHGIKGEA